MRREQINMIEKRIDKFLARFHAQEWILEEIPLEGTLYHSKEPLSFAQRTDGTAKTLEKGMVWGEAWDSAWVHLTGAVPADWAGATVIARVQFGGESCLFDDEGCPLLGMSNASIFDFDYSKTDISLYDACEGGEPVELWIETAANDLFGVRQQQDPKRDDPKRHGEFTPEVKHMELCRVDLQAFHFGLDMAVYADLMKALPAQSPRRLRILSALNEMIDLYAGKHEDVTALRGMLAKRLGTPANASDLTAVAVGHAHIDTGWLWPVRETIRKCGRTFSSQIALLETYPEYVFGASQPQHYQFVKDHYPPLYEKIKHWVKEGRWELQGAMWVEADCNLISGESMVRQFIHGKNFFMDEFGVDVTNLWIPDVFGYSASMPQIMRRAGVEFFVTQKISWSQFNEFPHNTFRWRGIDGSEIVTHFPPENNYNSPVQPSGHIAAQERFKENHLLDEYLSLYGMGNGGGGPAEIHVERALRMQDLEGCPKIRMDKAANFLERLRPHGDDLEVWFGELYLEMHRGTLTTQAHTKKNNRMLENRLRDVEYLCSLANLETYPRETLDRLWKVLLLNQFHDIIPGSSIRKVYEVTEAEHLAALEDCDALLGEAENALFTPAGDSLVLINTLSIPYTAPVTLPDDWHHGGVADDAGNALACQTDAGGKVALATLPPQGVVTLHKTDAPAPTQAADTGALENDLIRYEFAQDGTISRIFDKEASRDVLVDGARGNLLSLYEDRPNDYDAWDVDFFYEQQCLEHATLKSVRALEHGAVRQGLELVWTVGEASSVTQQVWLNEGSKRLDFVTEADWHESHKMLRVSFPTTVRSDTAAYEIQYGYVERPTHRNNSWDMAKFEVAAHTWADLSAGDYGVAILNDCKYGHKILDHMIDMNLLRSPAYPDPDADQGAHTFTYALLPHIGGLVESSVQDEAMMLNRKPLCFNGKAAGNVAAPVTLESAGISLEVVKKAEKDDCMVIRLVERTGRKSTGTLRLRAPYTSLTETNLMEWEDGEACTVSAEGLPVTLEPFAIHTYKVR